MILKILNYLQFFIKTKGRKIVCLMLLFWPLFLVDDVFAKSNAIIIDEWPVKTEGFGLLPTNGQVWKKNILSVYFVNYYYVELPPPLLFAGGSEEIFTERYYFSPNEAIWEAFKLWDEATELEFIIVNSRSEADIVVEWGDRYHLPNFKETDRTAPPLARTTYITGEPTIIYFVVSYDWFTGDHLDEVSTITNNEVSVKNVALHEIGHAIGLDHSSVDPDEKDSAKLNSIMYYAIFFGASDSLTRQDIIDTHKIYATVASKVDIDHDGVPETSDNCPCLDIWCDGGLWFAGSPTANTDQLDKDKDGVGDICDANNAPLTRAFLGLTSQPVATNVNNGTVFQLFASDPDDDILTFTLQTAAAQGEVVITSSGQVGYTPQFDFEGVDSFQYRVEDPAGLFAIDEININVVQPKHSMVITKTGSGDGRVTSNPLSIDCGTDCIADIASGDTVILKAEPTVGSVFVGWDGNCSSSGVSNTCTIKMDSGQIIIARFAAAPATYNLSVNTTGTGSGTITSTSADIDCGAECTADYANGANVHVTLNAAPDEDSVFRGWNGACSGTGDCTVTMYNDKNITATFATAMPTVFTVSNLNDNGTGSLRQAVLDANLNAGDDTITFLTELSGTIRLTNGQITITDSVAINGPGADVLTVSGSNASRIFEIDPGTIGTVSINGMSLQEGRDTSGNGGGGMIIETGTVTIDHVFLSSNSANEGGGGGGIRKFGPGSLTLSSSTLSGNTAIDEFNQGDGGGIRIDQGEGKLTIINSTLSGNSSANGGGITIDDGLLILTSSTVTGNSALNGGGGVSNGFSSQLTVSNSLVAGNTAPIDKEVENLGTFLSLGHNLFGENGKAGVTADTILASTDLILSGTLDTIIASLAHNGGATPTHSPVEQSPAIDAGSNASISGANIYDQRGAGFFRVYNGTVDIGAVESVILTSDVEVPFTGLNINFTEVPQVGDSVTLTTNAMNSTGGDVFYKFDLIPNYGTDEYDPFSNFTTIQAFSTSNSSTHTFTEAGGYIFVAKASPSTSAISGAQPIFGGSITVGEASGIAITDLTRSPTGNVQVGDSVTFTATATDFDGEDVFYQFDLIPNYGTDEYDPFNNFTTIQAFSTSNSSIHTFNEAGSYIFVVKASTSTSAISGAQPIFGGSINVYP